MIYQKWSNFIYVDFRTGLTFSDNMHESVEIVYILTGKTQLTIDGKSYTLVPGDAAIIFPHQVHSFVDMPRCNAYITVFLADYLKNFGVLEDSAVPECAVIDGKTTNIEKYFQQCIRLIRNRKKYLNQQLGAYVTLMLAEILEKLQYSEKKPSRYRIDVAADVFHYCNSNFLEDISLEKMEKDLNISKSQITRFFREKMNTTLKSYVNGLRLNEAKRLLKTTDKNITDIAIEAGFNTIRSFNRAFFAEMGETPTEYRKNKNKA